MTPRWTSLAGLLLLGLLSGCASSGVTTFANDVGAIRGYDPVAYHTESKPVKGSRDHTFSYQGATWYFASEANRDLFESDPARYAPAYGGFCAYGMSRGFAVATDPDAWTIVDGQLYLNYSLGVRRTWLKDVPGNIAKADANWLKRSTKS
ncbi:MAG: YHS domain-containing (seleno)protein [Pseudomonadota bacterium]